MGGGWNIHVEQVQERQGGNGITPEKAALAAHHFMASREQSKREDGAGSQDLLTDVDARMSEVGQELLLLMEELGEPSMRLNPN